MNQKNQNANCDDSHFSINIDMHTHPHLFPSNTYLKYHVLGKPHWLNLSMTDGSGLTNHKASVTPMDDHDENENATPKNFKIL